MGCFSSCINRKDYSDYEQRFPVLEIKEGSDSQSDSSLKARAEIASENRISNLLGSKSTDKEKVPLLEGSLRSLEDLNLSNSSSSVDMEMEKLNNYLQPKSENNEEEDTKSVNDENDTGRTFPGTKIDLNDIHSSDLSD